MNQRMILTPTDLDNHPLAAEYIEYNRNIKYPHDFQTWLKQRERRKETKARHDRERLRRAMDDPYCRSPNKLRRFT